MIKCEREQAIISVPYTDAHTRWCSDLKLLMYTNGSPFSQIIEQLKKTWWNNFIRLAARGRLNVCPYLLQNPLKKDTPHWMLQGNVLSIYTVKQKFQMENQMVRVDVSRKMLDHWVRRSTVSDIFQENFPSAMRSSSFYYQPFASM